MLLDYRKETMVKKCRFIVVTVELNFQLMQTSVQIVRHLLLFPILVQVQAFLRQVQRFLEKIAYSKIYLYLHRLEENLACWLVF